MTRRFVVRARAERDIHAAYVWYESQRLGLGNEFLDRLRTRLEEIRTYPFACQVVHRNVRRALMSGFPYVVFYVVDSARVAVLPVMHQYRDPASWPRGG